MYKYIVVIISYMVFFTIGHTYMAAAARRSSMAPCAARSLPPRAS